MHANRWGRNCLCAVGVATFVPHVDLMIALVGSFAATIVSLILPAIIDLCITWRTFHPPDSFTNHAKRSNGHTHRGSGSGTSSSRGRDIDINVDRARGGWRWCLYFTKAICIILVGVLGLLVGTFVSLRNMLLAIADDWSRPSPP